MRKFLSVLGGVAAAVLAMLAIEAVAHRINPSSRSGLVEAMTAPAKLIVAAGWFLATFAGAFGALRIANWPPAAWIVGLLVLAGGIANILAIPHPLWMQAAAVLLPLLAVAAALRLHARWTTPA